jgi:hypothetical protein
MMASRKNEAVVQRALNKLKDVVLAEMKELRFPQMATILQSYAMARLWDIDLFHKGYEHTCQLFLTRDQILTLPQITGVLLTMAKYYTKDMIPSLEAEPAFFIHAQ